MPVYNLSIPDTSPLIVYGGPWFDSLPADSQYQNGTFHATDTLGANATLVFNGTAVYLYGAKRGNHDEYTVTLDGQASLANGNDPVDTYQVPLFSASGLAPGTEHTVVLTNSYTTATPSYVDIDFVIVTAGDGDTATQSYDVTLDDEATANITYSANWDDTPNGLESQYYNSTMHRTNINGATATLSFQGNAVSVYGATSYNHGAFKVALDGGAGLVLNGSATTFRPQTLLYFASNLSNTPHTLSIANVDQSGLYFDLDDVVVSTWGAQGQAPSGSGESATGGGTPSPTSSGSPDSAKPHKSSLGPILGGALGALCLVLLLLGGAAILLRRRRRRQRLPDRIRHADPKDGAYSDGVIPMATDAEMEPFTPEFVVDPFVLPSPGSSYVNVTTAGLGSASNGSPAASREQLQVGAARPPWSPGQSKRSLLSRLASSEAASSGTPSENPHRDFPPPDYSQATQHSTAGSVSGGPDSR